MENVNLGYNIGERIKYHITDTLKCSGYKDSEIDKVVSEQSKNGNTTLDFPINCYEGFLINVKESDCFKDWSEEDTISYGIELRRLMEKSIIDYSNEVLKGVQ